MKLKINGKIRGVLFLSLTLIMASSFAQKVYSAGIKDKTRQNIAGALSIAKREKNYVRRLFTAFLPYE